MLVQIIFMYVHTYMYMYVHTYTHTAVYREEGTVSNRHRSLLSNQHHAIAIDGVVKFRQKIMQRHNFLFFFTQADIIIATPLTFTP
jgi:hypothetical protein